LPPRNGVSLLGRLADAGLLTAVRDSEGRRPNRYRLTALALEAFEVASLEELHEKLRPFLGGTAGAEGAVIVDGEGVSPAGESAGGALDHRATSASGELTTNRA
jgi:hypothetical protein